MAMVDQVPRVPPNVAELINELELAFGTPPQPGKERKPVINALVEIARFVRSVGCSWDVVYGLTDLAYALQDLDAGQVAASAQADEAQRSPAG
jgi:hypothetical protein